MQVHSRMQTGCITIKEQNAELRTLLQQKEWPSVNIIVKP